MECGQGFWGREEGPVDLSPFHHRKRNWQGNGQGRGVWGSAYQMLCATSWLCQS